MGECDTIVRYNCNKGERVKRHLKVKKVKRLLKVKSAGQKNDLGLTHNRVLNPNRPVQILCIVGQVVCIFLLT